MIMISHSNTLPSSTSPAEKPSTGCLFKSATTGASVFLSGCIRRAAQHAARTLELLHEKKVRLPRHGSCTGVSRIGDAWWQSPRIPMTIHGVKKGASGPGCVGGELAGRA